MWTCPRCNARLVQKNLRHSCGQYSVEGFLQNKTARGKELFWHFVDEFRKIGPLTLHPVKTRVALMVDVRFAAINRIGTDYIDGHLWLKEKARGDQFYRVEQLSRDDLINHFRIRDEREIDEAFRSFMRKAYEIGQRKHIKPRTRR